MNRIEPHTVVFGMYDVQELYRKCRWELERVKTLRGDGVGYKYSLIDLALSINDLPEWLKQLPFDMTQLNHFADIRVGKGNEGSPQWLIRELSNNTKHWRTVSAESVRQATTVQSVDVEGSSVIITISFTVDYKGKSYDVEDLCEALLTTWKE